MLTFTFYKLLPVQFLWFLALAVVAYLILNKHRLGNRFYAVGGNREAAVAVGINVFRTKMIAFVLCSVFASIAGIISVTRQHSATVEPQYFLELEAIAICVMGGVLLTGGRGAILGIVLGTFILQMVKDVLILSQAPGFYLDVFIRHGDRPRRDPQHMGRQAILNRRPGHSERPDDSAGAWPCHSRAISTG